MYVFTPLFTLHTISAAATTTPPTAMATNTTTTTTPMTASDTCDAGTSPPGATGDWDESTMLLLLDETIVDSITAVAATEVL